MKERNPEEYKIALAEIVTSVERLNLIINSLMELMQTNLDNRDFQNIRADELMWEIVDELAIKNHAEQIQVKYNLPEDSSKNTLQGNRRLLFIAISNIFKNAIKFSDGKQVYCEVNYLDRGIQILIEDQGIGIAEEDMEKIFQPFYRSANAIKFPGYGIGLSLTKNIVRLHNGTIQFSSKLGEGTRFTLFFPIG